MPRFSKESFSKLSTCHHDLQVLFFEVVKTFDCKILEGYRNKEDQDRAYREGNSKLKFPNGKHNSEPSIAVDVAPYPLPTWSKTQDFVYFGGYVMGVASQLLLQGKMKYAVRFGGDWDKDKRVTDETFTDLVHYELIV